MNKGRRNELVNLKHKKRLKNLSRGNDWDETVRGSHIYKTTGKPCSCWMCSPKEEKPKYKAMKHDIKVLTIDEVMYNRSSAYKFLKLK